jgi:hypothetical protein
MISVSLIMEGMLHPVFADKHSGWGGFSEANSPLVVLESGHVNITYSSKPEPSLPP